MTKCLWTAVLAASVVAISSLVSTAPAQQPGGHTVAAAPQAPGGIALLDITYLFKNLDRMKARMEQLKGEVQRAEAGVKQEKETIRQLAERLKEFTPGSPDYKGLEEQLAERTAKFQVKIQLERKGFLQREAEIYHTIYQEVIQEVQYFAVNNGFSMVLRFNGDPADKGKPEEVLRFINKPVVWASQGRDITPQILELLNRRSGPAHMPADNRGRPGAGVPRQPQR